MYALGAVESSGGATWSIRRRQGDEAATEAELITPLCTGYSY